MGFLNLMSLVGIVGLCLVAWAFSEKRSLRLFPWRIVITGIMLQLVLGFFVFRVPFTRDLVEIFGNSINVLFEAVDFGARFVFGRSLVPLPGQEPLLLSPLAEGATCTPPVPGEVLPGLCAVQLGYVFAFRVLPAVIFFSGFMALLYNLGIMQIITAFFAWIFYSTMRLSGAESLSGAANIFVGIESAIAVKPFLSKMTRSELLTVLSCCFGTSASSTLAVYAGVLRDVFPNIAGHLVSASIMSIPACFVLSKIVLPETGVPLTAGGIPEDTTGREVPADLVDDEAHLVGDRTTHTHAETARKERISPLDAAIVGALDGVKMAVSIAAVLILILAFVYLINQVFAGLANLPGIFGEFFEVITLQNLLGILFMPLTVLTGVSLEWDELWRSSVIIGRRLFETAIPPYQELAVASATGELSDRALVIISYALSGFAHLASVGIFVGGISALIPTRRREIASLGWKALFVGTLATIMTAAAAGLFYVDGDASILGTPPAETQVAPAPEASPDAPADAPADTPADAAPVEPEAEAPPAEVPPEEVPPADVLPEAPPEAAPAPVGQEEAPPPFEEAAPPEASP
ncbi:MAG: nucleoside:proton symporter [Kaiparowitsia implicata GSE-PSE-MK54-09C]|jgi:CNT family concentrative nucleoside transporter|nr:nucleoside:proton symporter [Kaiparowitsia implicata GSE-PSE-MK54-09C]